MSKLVAIAFAIFVIGCGDNIRPGAVQPDSQIPADCTPNATVCAGDDEVLCDAAGNEGSREQCAFGCDPTKPGCRTLNPTNLPTNTCATTTTANLAIPDGTTVTIDTAADCDLEHPQGAGEPTICVKHYLSVDIAAGGTLAVTGPNPLAIIAMREMTIAGEIDASAEGTAPGPGGDLMAGMGVQGPAPQSGGGGGGYLTAGGKGSSSSAMGGGGAGGEMVGTETISPLRGGAIGGRGGQQTEGAALAGHSGGGLQLGSCRTALSIAATAVLDANGGGGGGGNGSVTASIPPGGGGGGGTGGSILVEAGVITLTGGVFANGGGGGSGGTRGSSSPPTPGVDGMAGEEGRRSTTAAAGGVGQIIAGNGGAGGVLVAPTDGTAPSPLPTEAAGGGGGAAGRIRFNVRAGTTPTTDGATISPAHTAGDANAD